MPADIICSKKRSFPQSLFLHHEEAVVFVSLQLFRNRLGFENQKQFLFPNFSWGMFSHVTHLEQPRAIKNILRAMVCTLARRSRAKIHMARPNEPDMLPKRTIKVRLGIYRNQIHPKIQRYSNKISQALYRVARKENKSQQTMTNGTKSDE